MKHRNAQKQNPIMLVLAIAQVLLLLVIAIQLSGMDLAANNDNTKTGNNAAPTIAAPAPSAPVPSAPAAKVDMSQFSGHTEGSADAPVTIVEWSDFECPFCGRFYTQTLGSIRTDYIETGKVRLIYKNFPLLSLHADAQKAAEAAECAGLQSEDNFWSMHNMIFEKGVTGGVTTFKQYAVDLDLDTDKFNTCLDTGATAAKITADQSEGVANGITGTPGFLIGGVKVSGAQPYTAFQQAIAAATN